MYILIHGNSNTFLNFLIMYLHLIITPTPTLIHTHAQKEKHIYFKGRSHKLKSPPGEGVACLRWVVLRLVGIYGINSVTKCEMNHIVNQPRGRAREEALSIRADLQSSLSLRLLESSLSRWLFFNIWRTGATRMEIFWSTLPFCLSLSVCLFALHLIVLGPAHRSV